MGFCCVLMYSVILHGHALPAIWHCWWEQQQHDKKIHQKIQQASQLNLQLRCVCVCVCSKQEAQQAIDRTKPSHKQRIISNLQVLITAGCEQWRAIQLVTGGGGGSRNVPILGVGRAQRVSATDKAEAFAAMISQKCRINDPARLPLETSAITEACLQPIRLTPCDSKERLRAQDTTQTRQTCWLLFWRQCSPDVNLPLTQLFQQSNVGNYIGMPCSQKAKQIQND